MMSQLSRLKNVVNLIGTFKKENVIAVLYQHAPTPMIAGTRKPMKPNGYRDGSADIAYALYHSGFNVKLPTTRSPNPNNENDWVFPDTEEQINRLIASSVNMLWTNTVLYPDHPVYQLKESSVIFPGINNPNLQELDDKALAYHKMRLENLKVPRHFILGKYQHPLFQHGESVLCTESHILNALKQNAMQFPVVVKPLRGRGSEGVSVVNSVNDILQAMKKNLQSNFTFFGKNYQRFGDTVLVEEYLPGTEITLAILPPGLYRIKNEYQLKEDYWALPAFIRDGHFEGILPSITHLPPTSNAHFIIHPDEALNEVIKIGIQFARSIQSDNPLRIDCRKNTEGEYLIFDANIKPAITSGERTKKDEDKSLIALSAQEIGLSYSDLLIGLMHHLFTRNKLQMEQSFNVSNNL